MTSRRWLFLVPVLVFGILAIYFAVGLTRDPSKIPSALIDKPAPEFALPGIEGRGGPGFSTADLRQGEISVVNVFASWCVPCRAEHPVINRLAGLGVARVYGLNYKDKAAEASAWLDKLGDAYTAIGADASGRVGIDWGVYGVPETFIVDGAGIIRFKHVGPLTDADLEDTILPVIREIGS
ncbi:MAG: DsbE family thiol:disulfide interchange protein [Rhodospirillales bacterium]